MRPLPCPRPWMIVVGHYAEHRLGRADWLAEWRRRIAAIEAENRPAAERRRALEHALAINCHAFQATVVHGASTAVLDVIGAFAAADGRLANSSDAGAALAAAAE